MRQHMWICKQVKVVTKCNIRDGEESPSRHPPRINVKPQNMLLKVVKLIAQPAAQLDRSSIQLNDGSPLPVVQSLYTVSYIQARYALSPPILVASISSSQDQISLYSFGLSSNQLAVFFSLIPNQDQPAVFFSHNKSTPATAKRIERT